jgi:hypothetical protein
MGIMIIENFRTSDDKFRLSEIFNRMDNGKFIVDTDLIVDKQVVRNVLDGLPFGGVVWCVEDIMGNKHILFKQMYFNCLREFYKNELKLGCDVCYDSITPLLQSRFDDTTFTFRTIWHHPELDISEIKHKIEMNGG